MTTINDVRVAIINRLSAVPGLGGLSVDLNDNRSYKLVVNGSDTEWVRLTIGATDGQQTTLGGDGVTTRFDTAGLATVQVFTEIGSGEFRNDEIIREIYLEFVKQTGDRPIVYGGRQAGGDVRVVSVGRDGAWYQQNIIIPWWFDECIT